MKGGIMTYTEFAKGRDRLLKTLLDHKKVISRVTDPNYTQISADGLSLLRRQVADIESQLGVLEKEYANSRSRRHAADIESHLRALEKEYANSRSAAVEKR
jgi:hypothetical protein